MIKLLKQITRHPIFIIVTEIAGLVCLCGGMYYGFYAEDFAKGCYFLLLAMMAEKSL